MSFADFLSSYREKNSLSKRKLADLCNLSHTEIGRLEKGKDPSIDSIEKIAKGTNTSKEYLLSLAGYLDNNSEETKDKIKSAISDDLELADFWDKLKEREDLKLLFKQTKDMPPEGVRQIIRIIKAIEDKEEKRFNS